ncbi:MAG: hypothetical protein P8Z35_20545 [Ignavibacteriaceae bacterium]
MSKTFFGGEGKYEIYNESCIIWQKFNNKKELVNKYKVYNDVELIPSLVDKVSIKRIIDYEFNKEQKINLANA